MVNKYLKQSLIALAVICLIFSADLVLASDVIKNLNTAAGTELAKNTSPFTFLGTVVGVVLSMVGVALLITIIYAGIVWGFLSGGEAAKIQKAKDMIRNAIIGLVITLAAYGITTFIGDSLKKAAESGPVSSPVGARTQ